MEIPCNNSQVILVCVYVTFVSAIPHSINELPSQTLYPSLEERWEEIEGSGKKEIGVANARK